MSIPSSDLLTQAIAAYHRSPDERSTADVHRALDVSVLIVPGEFEGPHDSQWQWSSLPQHARLCIRKYPDGTEAVPAFTDRSKLLAWKHEGSQVHCFFAFNLLEMLAADGRSQLTINDGGAEAMWFSPQAIAAHLQRPPTILRDVLRLARVNHNTRRIDFFVLVSGSATEAWMRELATQLGYANTDLIWHDVLSAGPRFGFVPLQLGPIRGYTPTLHVCGLPPSAALAPMISVLASRADAVLWTGEGARMDDVSRNLAGQVSGRAVPSFVITAADGRAAWMTALSRAAPAGAEPAVVESSVPATQSLSVAARVLLTNLGRSG